MEHIMKERTEKKDVHGTGKKPYTSPTLKVYGDVEEITKVFRLAGAKGQVPSGVSDRYAKENFAPVDGREILACLATIPIETWNYKGEDPPGLYPGSTQDGAGEGGGASPSKATGQGTAVGACRVKEGTYSAWRLSR
jgi:hypothetical protein